MNRLLVILMAFGVLASGCIVRRAPSEIPSGTGQEWLFEFETLVAGPGDAGRRLEVRPTCAGPNDPLRDCAQQDPVWVTVGNASTTLTGLATKWFIARVQDCNHHTAHFGIEAAGDEPAVRFEFSRAHRLEVTGEQARVLELTRYSTEMACSVGV